MLEQSLLKNGFMQHSTRIQLWCPPEEEQKEDASHLAKSYIIDGHNRYKICQKHNIDLPSWCFEWLYFDTKDEAKKYIYENQLARRNLSPIQKISIAEQYRSIYEKQAKENQAMGGGDKKSKNYQKSVESNLSQAVEKKRNSTTDEKLSQIAGIKTTTYKMGAKVLKSDNEDLKKRVLSGETSISAGYKELMLNRRKDSATQKKETITPQQQIEKVDDRMNEIDKEISSLRAERESLMRRRSSLFYTLDIPCELKYEFIENDVYCAYSRECRFYIEIDGHKEIFVECSVYFDESPSKVWLMKIPEKYKNDFLMLWEKAHREDIEYYSKKSQEDYEKIEKQFCTNKDFYKKCYRLLAKNIHPDNSDGNIEAMQCLNQLKVMWGI